MKTFIQTLSAVVAAMLCMAAPGLADADSATLQPYVLAYTSGDGNLAAQTTTAENKLKSAGFQLLGAYSPYANAEVICITNPAMLKAAAAKPMGGFGAVEHVGLTVVNGKIQVTYLNPPYLAAAYRMGVNYADVAAALKQALGAQSVFGSKDGLSADDLSDYHYMIGMEHFDDVYQLGTHDSHAAAVKAVEDNLKAHVGGAAEVYRLDIPGTGQTMFGISRAKVTDSAANDKAIMADTIDPNFAVKTTAYLPYELLVTGKKSVALHMRFRMAVWHPGLSMMTFGHLMSSPGAIDELLKKIVGGKTRENSIF